MNRNYILLCLFGILIYCISGMVAREVIVGGHEVMSLQKIRYQATILIADHESRCGGGIIDKQFILTAAHCIVTLNGELAPRPISVLVGTYDLSIPGVVVEVDKVFFSLEYTTDKTGLSADIAVLKLKEPLDIAKHNLAQLYLPTYKQFRPGTTYENKSARIAGLGWDKMFRDSIIGEHSDNRFRYSDTDVRSDIECRQDHPHLHLTKKHLCARVLQDNHFQRGVCLGDGGGPLVLKGKTVIGILSKATDNCSEQNSSAIYTRISYYRKFIRNSMGKTQRGESKNNNNKQPIL